MTMTGTATEPAKWQNIDAGPRQVKDLQKAMGALRSEGQARDELMGVVGGPESRHAVIAMLSPVRAEVAALDAAIRARYDSKITRASVRQITADYQAALPEARKSRPVEDSRRSKAEEAALRAAQAERDAAYKAKQAAENAVMTQVLAKKPSGAKALIFAEYNVDDSDIQTDYFSSHSVRTVAIGWRFSAREDFRALHAAAAQFPETAHLGSGADVEHRENYSMGGGNYLSDGSANRGTGWVVKSRELPAPYLSLTEDAIPAAQAATAAPAPSAGGVTVSPSSLGREGVVEIRFADKPDAGVLAELKARGFRWARGNSCWYGTDTAFAETLAAAE